MGKKFVFYRAWGLYSVKFRLAERGSTFIGRTAVPFVVRRVDLRVVC